MVTIDTLKTLLENALNELVTDFKFILHSNIGEYEKAKQVGRRLPVPVVNAIFRPLQSTVVPVHQLNNFYMQMQLDILAPERFIAPVQDALTRFIEDNVGAAGSYSDNENNYAYVLNMNLPDIGAAEIFPHIGLGAPISTTVYFQFIKDGILSNECKLKIDDEEILTLNYSSARARINQTDNTENSEEMESVISQQGLQFNLVIPYLRRGKVQELVEDINTGGLGKTYTLAYDDGIVDKEWQVIIKDGSVSYQAGKVPTITVSFLLAREDIYG